MSHRKYTIGDRVEVQCSHLDGGAWVHGWVAGVVIESDYRMAAVQFECEVLSSNGWRIPDRTLWLAHGSRNIRPAETQLS
jgi:hypothetical protein